MAQNRPICILCNRSVVNRRRFEITHALFEENAANAQYIIEAIAPQQVSFYFKYFICLLITIFVIKKMLRSTDAFFEPLGNASELLRCMCLT